jgi:hypothetical protein
VDNFTGYSGSLYGQNGGNSSGGIFWTGSWGDQGFASSPNVVPNALGSVNGFGSTAPYVEYPLDNSQGGINVLEATRGFSSQSGQSAIFVYGLVAVGGASGGNFSANNSYGGIGLYAGGTEQFLVGERYQSGNWGATASGNLNGSGQDSSVAIQTFTTTLLLAEINQQTDTLTFWVNPDFNLTAAQNTPAFSVNFGTGDSTIDTIRLRGGSTNDGNKWQFDNINVTQVAPFAVPEPSGASLIVVGLAGLVCLRRRK